MHGSRTGNNEFLVDGAPSSGTGGGTGNWNYAPPVDAIEEFKIGMSSVDASFGRTSGGVINITLRSGTNQVRGSGILLHRGTWLDSNQIQNIRNNISNEEHKYYNGEGMMSGPIRQNKTFFMGGYQGFYENIPFPTTRTVPTEAQLRGDFSQTTTANGTPIIIYDPATTSCNASLAAARVSRSRTTSSRRIGGIRSLERCCPTSRGRTRRRATSSGSSNFVSSPNIGRYRYNSYLTRIDHVFNQNHRLSFSNSAQLGHRVPQRERAAGAGDPQRQLPDAPEPLSGTVDDNVTLNSATLWNTRFSWDRFDEPHDKEYGNVDPQLPFTGPYQLTGPPFPQINFDGYEGMFPRTFRQPKNDAYSVSSNLSKSIGTHFLKVGGEFRAYQFFRLDEVATNGLFSFDNQFTRRDPLSNTGAASGNGFATFLLGLPTGGNVVTGTPRTEQYRYYALYVQDDWKIASRLTLNLGRPVGLPAASYGQDNLTASGFDSDDDQSAAVAAAAGRGDHQPGDGTAAAPSWRPAVCEPWRTRVAVQSRLEQLAAADRRHLSCQRLAGRARQLRPVVPGALERRAGWRLHDRLPADDAVCRVRAERRRSRLRRGQRRFPTDSFSRWPVSWASRRHRHRVHGAESRLRDPVHRSVDGGRRRAIAVEHRLGCRLCRQPGQ